MAGGDGGPVVTVKKKWRDVTFICISISPYTCIHVTYTSAVVVDARVYVFVRTIS